MNRIRSTALQQQSATRRRGTVLIMFMLSLLLLSLTVGVLIRASLIQRNLVGGGERRVQADWIVHSAAARAAQQLKTNPEYSGETWNIPAEALGQPDAAVAEIEVTTDPAATSRRLVNITVNYPPGVSDRVRASRTVPVAVGDPDSN